MQKLDDETEEMFIQRLYTQFDLWVDFLSFLEISTNPSLVRALEDVEQLLKKNGASVN